MAASIEGMGEGHGQGGADCVVFPPICTYTQTPK